MLSDLSVYSNPNAQMPADPITMPARTPAITIAFLQQVVEGLCHLMDAKMAL
jgi:hypothetical protein